MTRTPPGRSFVQASARSLPVRTSTNAMRLAAARATMSESPQSVNSGPPTSVMRDPNAISTAASPPGGVEQSSTVETPASRQAAMRFGRQTSRHRRQRAHSMHTASAATARIAVRRDGRRSQSRPAEPRERADAYPRRTPIAPSIEMRGASWSQMARAPRRDNGCRDQGIASAAACCVRSRGPDAANHAPRSQRQLRCRVSAEAPIAGVAAASPIACTSAPQIG